MTQTLDTIERHLSTDPVMTGAVVDLTETVWLTGLDSGRRANLLRLGLLIDALSRELADESVAVYAVAERGLLSDTELTSNERMVLRRWSDDGLVEILPAGTATLQRVCEVGLVLGQPVLTRERLTGYPGSWLAPVPASGALALVPGGARQAPPAVGALSRLWRCTEPGCPSFDPSGGGRGVFDQSRGPVGQPPPQISANGMPVCPRHVERLADAGPRPYAVPLGLRVGGVMRLRFPLVDGSPVTVGRSPDERDGVGVAEYLDERASRWISRTHLGIELRDTSVLVTDLSTNGSVLLARSDRGATARREQLVPGQPTVLGEWDSVELFSEVELCRADRVTGVAASTQLGSVMGDAPTVALRLPRNR